MKKEQKKDQETKKYKVSSHVWIDGLTTVEVLLKFNLNLYDIKNVKGRRRNRREKMK